MTPGRHAKLESAGFKVGDAADFLGMDDEERRELDEWDEARRRARDQSRDPVASLRASLGSEIRRRREADKLTQAELAERIGSTAPRVSKVESAAVGIGLDLMFRAFFAVGGELVELAEVAAPGPRGDVR